jgi:xanthine dehydrogenase YagR molybdenum-binding subunit
MYALGAEFVEVRVHALTREIRVPRIVGAFAGGRLMNTRTARSQFVGGMVWGISSALHEATEIDRERARYINDNLADYLLPVNADIQQLEVILVPEHDDIVNPAGVKGIGELANVGTAAAVANAVYHATGIRVRELPIRLEKLLAEAPAEAGLFNRSWRRTHARPCTTFAFVQPQRELLGFGQASVPGAIFDSFGWPRWGAVNAL